MRGLVAQSYSIIRSLKKCDDLSALGEDGNVYPINNDLIDRYETFRAVIELGFDREEMLADDPCLENFIKLKRTPWEAVVFSKSLSIFQVGVIAYFWILQHPGVEKLVLEETPFVKSSYGNCVIRKALALAKKSFIVQNSFSFDVVTGVYQLLREIEDFRRCAGMVPESDDVKMVVRAVLDLMEVSYRANQGEYGIARDYTRSTGIDMWASLIQYDRDNPDVFKDSSVSVTAHQTMLALRLVDEMNAWDIEFEVES